jgi:hypothetical protein
VFLGVCCHYVYLEVTYVSYICCKCFIWMLHSCCKGFQVFHVFFCKCVQTYVFKCFIRLQTYVANVLYGCIKSRSDVAHVVMVPVVGERRHAASVLPRAARLALSSPPFSFSPSHHGSSSSVRNPIRRAHKRPREMVAPGGPTATRCSHSDSRAS